ncbi:MAG: hypothetical protein ACYCOU_24545 [Sulfobacillus sp.]
MTLDVPPRDCPEGNHCKIFIYRPILHPSQKLLPILLSAVPADDPWLLLWGHHEVWSMAQFLALTGWAQSTSAITPPLTVVARWEGWGPPERWFRAQQRMPVPQVRWIWAVSRASWPVARSPLQALSELVLPDDERLAPQFTGWMTPNLLPFPSSRALQQYDPAR